MNKGDFLIFSGCLMHLFIWLFVAFGGFFSTKILFLNVFIILPIVYIAQAQKNHPITKEKIKYILNNMTEFSDPEPFVSYCYNKVDPKEVEHLKKELNGSEEEIIKAILIMQSYENCLGIPKLITIVYRNFCDSYRNPLDPQGFIVLAFILNSWAFLMRAYMYK
jgi:hypothetical protein